MPQWAGSCWYYLRYIDPTNTERLVDPELERYQEIPSDGVPFEQRPWMKAAEITDTVVDAIHKGDYRMIRLNLANGDMVGHTGDRQAAIQAVTGRSMKRSRSVAATCPGATPASAEIWRRFS